MCGCCWAACPLGFGRGAARSAPLDSSLTLAPGATGAVHVAWHDMTLGRIYILEPRGWG
jgi:hypothetical protein